jgi:serine phosphatase RsbU (regulator of sigma subunit)/ligand-binding sensor domain-containing protein
MQPEGVLSSSFEKPTLIVEIERTETPPIIDGNISDWSQENWIQLGQDAPYMPLDSNPWSKLQDDGATEPKGTATTDADLSGSFALRWDEEWIYLAVQVTDNVHDVVGGNREQWYFEDSVSLFLDIPLDGDGSDWIKGDHSFSFVADPTYPDSGKWWRNGENVGDIAPPETKLAVELGKGGNYILEAAIPMSALMEATPQWYPPFEERMVGFMVVVTDPDGGENSYGGQLMYGGVDDNDANWSRLRFRPSKKARPPHYEFGGLETGIGKIKGKIKWEDMDEGTRLGKVRIQSLSSEESWVEVKTDSQGVYEVDLLVGEYRLEVGYRGTDILVADKVWVPPKMETQILEVAFPDLPPGTRGTIGMGITKTAGPGRITYRGPGFRRGPWHLYGLADGPSIFTESLAQDSTGTLWIGTARQGAIRYDGLSYTYYTTADGLPANTVTSILHSRNGSSWFGTNMGVCRYSGGEYTTYTTDDGLPHNFISSIYEDAAGNIWLGTRGGGVVRLRNGQLLTLNVEDGLAHDNVGFVVGDARGRLWIGTQEGVSIWADGRIRTLTSADGLALGPVSSIVVDAQGRAWFGHESQRGRPDMGGLSVYDGTSIKTYHTEYMGLMSKWVQAMVQDLDGNLWLGFNGIGGLVRQTGDTHEVLSDPLRGNVSAMLRDRDGVLWFSYIDGLARYDAQLTVFPSEGLLSEAELLASHLDRQGRLWFGTWSNGAVFLDDGNPSRFRRIEGLPDSTVRLIYQDQSNDMWFGTVRSGVVHDDGQRLRNWTMEDGLSGNNVKRALQDQSGILWLATDKGINCYDGNELIPFADEKKIPCYDQVSAIYEDHEGVLWFGTGDCGVSSYDRGSVTTFTVADGLVANGVHSIFQDRHGVHWFGGGWSGITSYDGETFTTYTTKDGFGHRWGGRTWERADGVLLFSGGHTLFDGVVFQTLFPRDGCGGIMEVDSRGDIWSLVDSDVVRYRPRTTPPPIAITDIVLQGRLGPQTEIRLSTEQKLIAFEYRVPEINPRLGRTVFRYRLRGREESWQQTWEHRVEYSDLPTGQYVFEVEAVDCDLNYSEKPATVKLTVHPPYGLIVLLSGFGIAIIGFVIASGYGIKRNRERNRAQRERDQAREQLVQELEEELQTAHDMQMGLMPTESPKIQGFDISGRCLPATHVGGDFFQYYPISDNRLAISLADVTGHAMEAAVPVMMFSGILDTQMETGNILEDLFARLNRSLHRNLDSRTFVCFTMGELDTTSKKFRLSNGGCPYPYHYQVSTGEITELQVDGYPLGVRAEATYPVIETQLESGDRIIFCSDGIIEAENSEEEMFGFERTEETIRKGCQEDLSAPQLLDYLIGEVKTFTGDTPQGDDQTVVILGVNT